MARFDWILVLLILMSAYPVFAQETGEPNGRVSPNQQLAAYFRAETEKLRQACLADVESLDEWNEKRVQLRQQLFEMLGLSPMPHRTDLKVRVTGTVDEKDFVVRKLHFQSRPGLYVTGNLYVPRKVSGKLPAILYVCGHGRVSKNGISYGNKVHYQHHGAWFARNGYVCLTIDTLQLGEIEGIHHGTYREKMWWWLNRGYTPAGVEAWNCIRSIDLLQSLPEVDPQRIGVTGRSGGGAYSWWIAAIDERIRCAVPVAGITDLTNHVVDGCVEGHCDCMYMVNTYRWDYPLVAALVAPRPLLISNTDSDRIFPLDGVYRTFVKTRKIYQLYGAADKIALNITAGPHKDTQELRVHAFRWLNHHLRQDDSLIRFPAEKFFQPEQLKVFQRIPADQKNTTIQETFVAPGQVPVPPDLTTWKKMAKQLRESVRKKCFQGWPEIESPLNLQVLGSSPTGIGKLRRFDYSFSSQPHVELGFSLFTTGKPDQVRYCLVLIAGEGNADRVDADNVLTENNRGFFRLRLDDATADRIETIDEFFRNPDRAVVVFSPRGIGKYAWQCDSRFQTQLRRRFYLLGQTVDTMRIYDIKRALKALKQVTGESSNGSTDRPKLSLAVAGDGTMAVNAAYATILGADVNRLQLYQPPTSHRNGPYLLNIRRILDVPHAIALAADKTELLIRTPSADDFVFPVNTNRLSGGAPRLLIISD